MSAKRAMVSAKCKRAVTGLICSYLVPRLSQALCLLLFSSLFASAAAWTPEAVLKAYLKDHYPWAEVEISDLQLSAEPPANPPVAVIVEKTPGRSVYRFEFKGGETVVATAHVRAFDRVLMSRSALRKGYMLKRDDIYQTLMESGRIPKGAVRAEELLIGKELVRSIVPNVPITDAMVSETPLVKRGRRVVLCVASSEFTIKAMGETKNDAAVGEYVKAVNVLSKKIVTGLLVDENTVRVEY